MPFPKDSEERRTYDFSLPFMNTIRDSREVAGRSGRETVPTLSGRYLTFCAIFYACVSDMVIAIERRNSSHLTLIETYEIPSWKFSNKEMFKNS